MTELRSCMNGHEPILTEEHECFHCHALTKPWREIYEDGHHPAHETNPEEQPNWLA